MVSLCALVVFSADVSHIPPGEKNFLLLQWQTTLMDRFYSRKSKVKAKTKSTKESKVERADSLRNAPLRDYCEWKSVSCVHGKVVRVDRTDRHDEVMDIHLLPPTVGDIHLTSCSLDYALHTRALPRALKYCYVNGNRLHGSVGLRTLPEHLVRLNLSRNRLVGPVDLTELPRKLRTLDLWDNRIRQYVVFFGQLPPNLIYVEFHLIGGGNRIGELRGTSTENAKKLGKLFPGISLKHIHIE
ncbi:leucine-rich repeat [Perkinsela sp. CCAP 1560/4]|nr:leucine-rich repeat [Perkinsela sp. CCAP 1560/4]|eukprot:KNH06501.1 leucine-rich repeat [Perkinsela sp. CCAP 1560/4]